MDQGRDHRGLRDRGRGSDRSGAQSERVTEEQIKAVLDNDAGKIDEFAERLGGDLHRVKFSSSQIRNFYGPLAKLRAERDDQVRRDALRVHRSRVAYLVARSKGTAALLWDWFEKLLKKASSKSEIEGVLAFAEAIVAYHKFASDNRGGGRDD